ncbi:YbaB/EbfC family nucleoid-associated protein [Sphaerisporangium fuscum]|uniref:YbaB/EbfC family nucleoid-associated protein n=1 Tax=Sphaerisporangium fuscum TaxID=2835868 RepID=UPI001BDDB302|nr:YbaB/EbfC family nucleoid-associated protein [Sphaerisporangium fuscum]
MDMNESWAMLEQLVKKVNEQTERLRQAHQDMRELSATARSKGGLVSVTVGPRGEVRAIELDPRVYRKLSPSELAASIMEQISAATREVTGAVQEAMEPFLPEGVTLEDLLGEAPGAESLLLQETAADVDDRTRP